MERLNFEFEGRQATLICPDKPAKDKKWLLKTEYFTAFPSFQDEMVNRGWHLAHIKSTTRWCVEEDLDLRKRFADYLCEHYGLNRKCVPVGMSCGGMVAIKFAAKYPSYVSSMYIDAPVINLLSCPAALGNANYDETLMSDFTHGTGMTVSDLISYREHPLDKLGKLAESKIPVIMVYGDCDTVVPYEENGALLEKCYKDNDVPLVVIPKKGCEHHPHGLEDNSAIIEFVEKYN